LATPDIVIAQIGYGYWGPNLARCYTELEGVRLKYICDATPENLNEARGKCPGVQLVSRVEKVIEDGEVNAVVIASPAATHYRLADAALSAGKHVFVEKPMSLDAGQGRALVRKAGSAGLVLFVGHVFLYHPAVRFMKQYLLSGDAGKILYLYSSRLNLGRFRSDENCLWSLAPHDISIMLYLLGEGPESVIAQGASYLKKDLEDVVILTLYFPDGVIGNAHVSWLDPHKVRKVTVVCSEQMLVFDDMSPDGKVKVYDRKVYPAKDDGVMGFGDEHRIHFGEETMPSIRMEEPLLLECAQFRDCISNGSVALTDGHQGLEVLRVLEAASRSLAAGGRRISVEV
jgi:predicted dehydrogenase